MRARISKRQPEADQPCFHGDEDLSLPYAARRFLMPAKRRVVYIFMVELRSRPHER